MLVTSTKTVPLLHEMNKLVNEMYTPSVLSYGFKFLVSPSTNEYYRRSSVIFRGQDIHTRYRIYSLYSSCPP